MEIYPPIPERTTEQLIDIVETKEQWQPEVVVLAQQELIKRGIPAKTQENRREIRAKFEKRVIALKSGASFSTNEKVLIVLFWPVLAVLFQDLSIWYIGQGFTKKNRQGAFYFLLRVAFWALVFYCHYTFF